MRGKERGDSSSSSNSNSKRSSEQAKIWNWNWFAMTFMSAQEDEWWNLGGEFQTSTAYHKVTFPIASTYSWTVATNHRQSSCGISSHLRVTFPTALFCEGGGGGGKVRGEERQCLEGWRSEKRVDIRGLSNQSSTASKTGQLLLLMTSEELENQCRGTKWFSNFRKSKSEDMSKTCNVYYRKKAKKTTTILRTAGKGGGGGGVVGSGSVESGRRMGVDGTAFNFQHLHSIDLT